MSAYVVVPDSIISSAASRVPIRTNSGDPSTDVRTFVDALAFNWLVGGTDAHAKNYAVLHGGGGRIRLAPLYDLASILPYDAIDVGRAKLSMKVGGSYRLAEIDAAQWRRAARDLGLRADETLHRVSAMATALPERLDEVITAVRAAGIQDPIVDRLARRLAERARACGRMLEASGAADRSDPAGDVSDAVAPPPSRRRRRRGTPGR